MMVMHPRTKGGEGKERSFHIEVWKRKKKKLTRPRKKKGKKSEQAQRKEEGKRAGRGGMFIRGKEGEIPP